MLNFIRKMFVSQIKKNVTKRSQQKASLSVALLEDRTTPSVVNIGTVSPSADTIFDDGIINSVVLQADGSLFANDLSDAIGFANGLTQGGNGVPTSDPVGPHTFLINANIVLLSRLPVLAGNAVIKGNTSASSYTPIGGEFLGFEEKIVTTKGFILSFGGNFRVLHSVSNSLRFENLLLGGGLENGNGGVVLFEGTNSGVSFDNCKVVGGHASGNGGGLYSTRAVTITNSQFAGNSATNGGSIYFSTASAQGFVFENSEVRSSSASGNGGSIWVSTLGYVTINDSNFTLSEAFGIGGSIYVYHAHQTDVSSTYFTESFAATPGVGGLTGGAMYLEWSRSFSYVGNVTDSTNPDLDGDGLAGYLGYDPIISPPPFPYFAGAPYYFIVMLPTPHVVSGVV